MFRFARSREGREKSIHVFPGPAGFILAAAVDSLTRSNFFCLGLEPRTHRSQREMLQREAQAAGSREGKSIVFLAFGAFSGFSRAGDTHSERAFGDSSEGWNWTGSGRGSLWDGINFIFGRDTDTKNFIPVFFVPRAIPGASPAQISVPAGGSGWRKKFCRQQQFKHSQRDI